MTQKDTADAGVVLVLITVPDRDTAGVIATTLVERRLAAAVHIAEIESVYRWQGAVHRGGEFVLTAKTLAACFAKIEIAVDELHPYELSPVIQIAIERTKPDYAAWIARNVCGKDGA